MNRCTYPRPYEVARALSAPPRDTDGSPEGRDAQRLDGEAATAGAEGIAQPKEAVRTALLSKEGESADA